jgi:hypothetical protein
MSTLSKQIFRDRTRPHPAHLARRPQFETLARHRYFLFPVPDYHMEFLAFSSPPNPLSPTCSPPPGCFYARYFAHAGGPVRYCVFAI